MPLPHSELRETQKSRPEAYGSRQALQATYDVYMRLCKFAPAQTHSEAELDAAAAGRDARDAEVKVGGFGQKQTPIPTGQVVRN